MPPSFKQEDFIFSTHEENQINVKDLEAENRAVDTETKNAKSEGLMDRKEVLGGMPVFVLGCIMIVQHFRFSSKTIFGAVHGDTNMPSIYNSLKQLFFQGQVVVPCPSNLLYNSERRHHCF